jgi:hypothetical protein
LLCLKLLPQSYWLLFDRIYQINLNPAIQTLWSEMVQAPCPLVPGPLFLPHWSLATDHWSLPRSGHQVRLITVTSGLALSLTGVKVVPIPRLT